MFLEEARLVEVEEDVVAGPHLCDAGEVLGRERGRRRAHADDRGLAPVPAPLVVASFLVAGMVTEHDRTVGVLSLAIVAIYTALFVIGQSSLGGLTETTAVLAGLAVLGSYMIHRYELVVLGLVDE